MHLLFGAGSHGGAEVGGMGPPAPHTPLTIPRVLWLGSGGPSLGLGELWVVSPFSGGCLDVWPLPEHLPPVLPSLCPQLPGDFRAFR